MRTLCTFLALQLNYTAALLLRITATLHHLRCTTLVLCSTVAACLALQLHIITVEHHYRNTVLQFATLPMANTAALQLRNTTATNTAEVHHCSWPTLQLANTAAVHHYSCSTLQLPSTGAAQYLWDNNIYCV